MFSIQLQKKEWFQQLFFEFSYIISIILKNKLRNVKWLTGIGQLRNLNAHAFY